MARSVSYGVGYDGTTPGIGGCPFEMDRLQKEFIEGSVTPTKIISFGPGMETGCTTSVDGGFGVETLDLLANSCYFESATSSLRNPGLIKPGSARASDFWGVIPGNVVVPKLVQKLHQGAIDKVIVYSLAFINREPPDMPFVVQTVIYESCFVKFVDPVSYGFLTVFSFAFAKVTIEHNDVAQISAGGKNAPNGKYVYVFDYNANSGQGA